MRNRIHPALVAAAACTLIATPAIAQTNGSATSQHSMMTAIAPAKNISKTEVQEFAAVIVKLNQIKTDASISAAQKKPAMIAALKASGLSPQRFNGIAKAAQTDPAVRARVEAALPAKPPAK